MAELPTTPGAVVNIDGDRAMLTKFGNWVAEGVFTLTNEQVEQERYVVEYDPAGPTDEDMEVLCLRTCEHGGTCTLPDGHPSEHKALFRAAEPEGGFYCSWSDSEPQGSVNDSSRES